MDTEKIRMSDSYKSLLFKKITDLNHSRFTRASTSAESALRVLATLRYTNPRSTYWLAYVNCRKVIIVSPHFSPTTLAFMNREQLNLHNLFISVRHGRCGNGMRLSVNYNQHPSLTITTMVSKLKNKTER